MALPKSILLIITGSVASYKALELIRLLKAEGTEVHAILTKGGAKFVTALAVSSLTGTKTYDDLFSLTDEVEMGHIELSRIADVVLVAPATADIMAKMAAGMADDLATTALLATNKPVIVAPAMNHKMWSHAATQRNVARLKADGIRVIAPTEGAMACGEFGIGRLAEPAAIIAAIKTTRADGALKGKTAMVTSGPTFEPIDPVRFIGNHSSGKQGLAIAAALAEAGAEVTLLSGVAHVAAPLGVTVEYTPTADMMRAAVLEHLPADIFVGAAAVADWKMPHVSPNKIKKHGKLTKLVLELVPTVDILQAVCAHKKRPALVVGFAAETENMKEHATAKRRAKGCDWLVANDVSGHVFGSDENEVLLITEAGAEAWPRMQKSAVAEMLVEKMITHFEAAKTKKETAN